VAKYVSFFTSVHSVLTFEAHNFFLASDGYGTWCTRHCLQPNYTSILNTVF